VDVRPGTRLKSTVCQTEVVVVKPPNDGAALLRCGGAELVAASEAAPTGGSLDPALSGGTLLGKRYIDDVTAVELLCTRQGEGTLTIADRILEIKAAIALPTTD
jgi:hypothetical protein